MIRRVASVAVFLFFMFASAESWATHVSIGAASGHTGPITTVPATTLKKGAWGLDLQTEFIKFDTLSEGELVEFAGQDREVHNVDYLHTSFFGLSYGITDKLTVHMRMPYVYRNDISESEPPDEVHRHGNAKGVGDLSVHFHQKVFKADSGDFLLTLIAGIDIPTGRTSAVDDHGGVFEAEFQPGSGSWNPSVGFAATKNLGRLSLDGNLLYTIVNEGTQDTDLGDRVNYNLSFSYRAMLKPFAMDLIGELNGIWVAKEKVRGVKDPDSGGNTILFSPGMRVNLGNGFMLYGSYSAPVMQDLNGTQNEIAYRFTFGINYVR